MLISIIVPVYNAEKYLYNCIDSLLKQSFDDYEIILVDDGSSDSSSVICDEYSKKNNNIVVIHQTNKGVSKARQIGVKYSSGKYLAFIDSDDWVSSSFISSMVAIIEKYCPDIICFGSYQVSEKETIECPFPMDSKLYKKKEIIKYIYNRLIEKSDGTYFPNELCMKLIKRELYVNNQVQDKKIMMGEDAACIKPCIAKASSIFIDDGLYYYYRRNDESVTVSGKPLLWDGPALIAEHYKNTLDLSKYDFQAQVYRNVVHNLFNVAVSQFSKEGSYLSISKSIKKELLNPIYDESIKNARFTSLFGIICEFSIRHRICFIFYLRWLQKYGIKQMKKKISR